MPDPVPLARTRPVPVFRLYRRICRLGSSDRVDCNN